MFTIVQSLLAEKIDNMSICWYPWHSAAVGLYCYAMPCGRFECVAASWSIQQNQPNTGALSCKHDLSTTRLVKARPTTMSNTSDLQHENLTKQLCNTLHFFGKHLWSTCHPSPSKKLKNTRDMFAVCEIYNKFNIVNELQSNNLKSGRNQI